MPEQKDHLFSFWAEYNLYSSGRDPLGVRNSSAVIFSKLLPGLTSATKRIRFYGFYPWILTYYYKNNLVQNRDDQMLFIRRCEVLLSYIMASRNPRLSGLDGNTYAESQIDKIAKGDNPNLDIHEPARFYKNDGSKTYYQIKGGVLQVVYLGSLINMGLVFRMQNKGNIVAPTEDGLTMSKAFEAGIHEKNRNLFFEVIEGGKIQFDQLSGLLEDFDLFKDVRGSEEWTIYKRMLIGPDIGNKQIRTTTFRRENIRTFLEIHKISPIVSPERDYPDYFFQSRGFHKQKQHDCYILWYLSELSEKIHFCQEAVFWCILQLLDKGERRIPIPVFAEKFAGETIESIFQNEDVQQPKLTLEQWTSTLTDEHIKPDSINTALRKKDYRQVLRNAVVEWFALYKCHSKQFSELEACAMKYGLSGYTGGVSLDYKYFFELIRSRDLPECFGKICLRLVNQHMEVAFAKMNQGRNNVLRITVEDNCLIKLENDYPAQVANRVSQFQGFLSDMKFIDKSGLTQEGEALLIELEHE